MLGRENVLPDVHPERFPTRAHAGLGGQMEDVVGLQLRDIYVKYVFFKELEAFLSCEALQVVQLHIFAVIVRQAVNPCDVVPLGKKLLRKMGAYETGYAGNYALRAVHNCLYAARILKPYSHI